MVPALEPPRPSKTARFCLVLPILKETMTEPTPSLPNGKVALKPLGRFRVFLAEVFEPGVRLLGWVGAIVGRDPEGVEMVLRGLLLGGAGGLRVGRNVRFVGRKGAIRLGRKVAFYGNTYVNANGPQGAVCIGEESHVDQYCVLYGQGGISIGRRCAIASGTLIYSQTNADTLKDGTPIVHQPTVYAPVSIGDDCWLGAGVRVLPGVTMGEGVHVGAGAVVHRDLEPRCVAAGVPAKVLKKR